MHRLLAAALAAAVLGGCSARGENDDPGPRSTSPGSLAGALRVQAAGGEGELKALQALVDAFEKAHPAVQVDFTGVADQGDHLARLTTGFAAGRAPDVFLLNYRRAGAFLAKGVVAPVPADGVDVADLYDAPKEAFTQSGVLQCVPQNASSSVIYVNPALFAKAGLPLPLPDWTMTELAATAAALGAKGVESIGFEPGMRTVAPFAWSFGGEVVDDIAKPTSITLLGEETEQALRLLLDLQRSGFDARQRAAEEVQDAFAAGKLAMLVDSRRAVPALRKSGVAFDVRPLPKARTSTSLLAADGWCVAKNSRNLAAAHAFAAFSVGAVGGAVLAESGRTVPASRRVARSPAFLDPTRPPASSQVFLDAIPTLRRLPNVAAQNEAEEVADDALEQFFAGRLSLDRLIETVNRATTAVYAQQR
ncbi:MAG TPA: extracellular solute-binding protein [Mycobacteriales bacterium]|nr:extracellular solute-binding protein [Mycobacteriales bacterium]